MSHSVSTPTQMASLRFVCAGFAALGLGAAVYLLARPAGSSHLPWGLGHDLWPALTGPLPALSHTLAFALLSTAAWGPSRDRLRRSVGLWVAIGWAFELLQHPRIATATLPHPGALNGDGPITTAMALLARHAHLGTFDPLDLVATALGGGLALLLGSRLLALGWRR